MIIKILCDKLEKKSDFVNFNSSKQKHVKNSNKKTLKLKKVDKQTQTAEEQQISFTSKNFLTADATKDCVTECQNDKLQSKDLKIRRIFTSNLFKSTSKQTNFKCDVQNYLSISEIKNMELYQTLRNRKHFENNVNEVGDSLVTNLPKEIDELNKKPCNKREDRKVLPSRQVLNHSRKNVLDENVPVPKNFQTQNKKDRTKQKVKQKCDERETKNNEKMPRKMTNIKYAAIEGRKNGNTTIKVCLQKRAKLDADHVVVKEDRTRHNTVDLKILRDKVRQISFKTNKIKRMRNALSACYGQK